MGNALSTNEQWIQTILQQLTPRFGEFASDILSHQVEPLIQRVFQKSNVPNVEFKFTKLDFGDVPPTIDNLETHGTPEGQDAAKSVTVDFDFKYLGNCDLQVSILGIQSGVRDVQMSARARLVMKPTTKEVPFVGGLQFCFLTIPVIDFNLDGIADLIDWPPLKRRVRKEIQEDIAKRCVYPNFYTIPTSSNGANIEAVKSFEASGLVLVKLLSGENFAKKGGLSGSIRSLIGQNKPDPYGKIKLGALIQTSSVVKDNVDPIWNEDKPLVALLDTLKGHEIRVDFYDEDSLSRDNFLGHIVKSTNDLPSYEIVQETLKLLDDPIENDDKEPTEVSGQATLEFQFLPSLTEQPDDARFTITSVFIYSFNNLLAADSDTYPNTQALVQVGNDFKVSQIFKDTPHPAFEESFIFVHKSQEDVTVKILDADTGSELGSLILSTPDFPIKRKILSVNSDQPYMTVTLSANLKYC